MKTGTIWFLILGVSLTSLAQERKIEFNLDRDPRSAGKLSIAAGCRDKKGSIVYPGDAGFEECVYRSERNRLAAEAAPESGTGAPPNAEEPVHGR